VHRSVAFLIGFLLTRAASAAAADDSVTADAERPSKPALVAADVPDTPVAGVEADPGDRPVPWLAAGASIIPGLLVHGAGHFAAGESSNGYRLLAIEGVGIAGIVGGLATLRAVRGSEKLAPVYVPVTVTGVGLFIASFLADVAGTLHGQRPWPVPRPPGTLTLTGGYTGLFASKHTFSHLGRLGAEWHYRRLTCGAALMLHPEFDYSQYGGTVSLRLWEPGADDPVTRLTVFVDAYHQRFRTEGFSITAFRGFGELRWNMGYLVTTMRNAWWLARLGWGFDLLSFDNIASGEDGLPFIVFEVGMGLMASERVSLELVYRQRKGELPGGMTVAGALAGFLGMIEFQSRVTIDPRWTIVPGFRIGNGVMPWLWVESTLF
jgi:hypothetical protein